MTQPPVALVPLQCVRCQNPIPAQPDEVLWVCATCGQAQMLTVKDELVPQTIHYVSGLAPEAKGKPVWVFSGQAELGRTTYDLFDKKGEMQEFWAQPRWFFIPAYTLPLEQFTEASVQLLREPPVLQEGNGVVPFFPVTVQPEDLQALAEFIVLTVEAGRRDHLKQLDMVLRLGMAQLWILP